MSFNAFSVFVRISGVIDDFKIISTGNGWNLNSLSISSSGVSYVHQEVSIELKLIV